MRAGKSHAELEPVLRLIGSRTGLSFPADRRSTAEGGVRRAMARAAVSDVAAYLALLVADGAALDDLLAELTVGETYFFRDPAQFEVVRRDILPGLRAKGGIRAWSAGCATGEEAYSLAMILREAGLPGRVLGTDLSAARLSVARRGRYTRWSLRGVGEEIVERYFRRAGNRFELDRAVCEAVDFRELNLAVDADTDVREMDLVFCRNVLIYLERERIPDVARRLLNALSGDGWLVLGASDPPLAGMVECEVVVTTAGLAYRRAQPGRTLVARGLDARPVPVAPYPRPAAARPPPHDPTCPIRPCVPGGGQVSTSPPAEDAAACYAARDYARAAALAAAEVEAGRDDAAAWIVLVRSLANQGRMAEAGRASAAALDRHRTSAELRYLHAVLLAGAGRHLEAAEAARHALYLDRDMAVAHLLLGSSLARIGDGERARHALRNAERLFASTPPLDLPPGSDGEPAAGLAGMARTQLRLLDGETA